MAPPQPTSILPGDPEALVAVDDEDTLRRLLLVPRIVWAGMLAATGLYVAVGVYVAGASPPAAPTPMPLVYGLAGVAAAIVVALAVVRRRLLPPSATTSGPALLRRREAAQVGARSLSGQILSLALCEAIAVLGLVLTFIGHEIAYVVAFGAVGAGAMIVCRPTPAWMSAMLRAAAERRADA